MLTIFENFTKKPQEEKKVELVKSKEVEVKHVETLISTKALGKKHSLPNITNTDTEKYNSRTYDESKFQNTTKLPEIFRVSVEPQQNRMTMDHLLPTNLKSSRVLTFRANQKL